MKKTFFIFLFLGVIFFSYCKKDSGTSFPSQSFIVNATSKTKWVYFSFVTNDTVNISNPRNSTAWDLAFKNFYIRTNSGLSGKGKGGADSCYMDNQAGFNSYVTVSDTITFQIDKWGLTNYMGFIKDTLNPVLNNWYTFDKNTDKYIPTNSIFVIRTALGNYAKLWVQSYYNIGDSAVGYMNLKYAYQSNGSKNF